jgi:hypothetical protein
MIQSLKLLKSNHIILGIKTPSFFVKFVEFVFLPSKYFKSKLPLIQISISEVFKFACLPLDSVESNSVI